MSKWNSKSWDFELKKLNFELENATIRDSVEASTQF